MSREEAAAKAQFEAVTGKPWESAKPRSAKLCREDAAAIVKAADAHDLAHGVHRIVLDEATVERASEALYEHRQNGLTCYDHNRPGQWCCVCGEHSITEVWRTHMARAVLSAAVQEER